MICPNCNEREGTLIFGDALSISHGWAPKWCERCVLVKQIEHCKERMEALPGLEARLAELDG